MSFIQSGRTALASFAVLCIASTTALAPQVAHASGGGGTSPKVDTIKVSKCYYDAGSR